MTFFKLCDFLYRLVPNKRRREYLRQIKLYDWYRKYMALKHTFPELNFRHTKMVKGGWNIGFIVDKKYVFKVRKQVDSTIPHDKIVRQKRITDALTPYSPLKILNTEIVKIGEYVFYKYDFIPGKNLNEFSFKIIMKHRKMWAHQIADFIYQIHNARPSEIADLQTPNGDGWNHNDLCNNMIVNPKTMKIIGVIDWEYSGWGDLETEINNCTLFSNAMRKSGIGDIIRTEYNKLAKT